MTMAAFQRAFADLAASPKLCLAVRSDAVTALAIYDLNPKEIDRLAQAVWQRGMDANCTLYRVTRLTPLNTVLPLTLGLLREDLRALLDTYWEEHSVHDVQFAREAGRFISWLEQHRAILPEPADGIVELARRELAAEYERLTSPLALKPAPQ